MAHMPPGRSGALLCPLEGWFGVSLVGRLAGFSTSSGLLKAMSRYGRICKPVHPGLDHLPQEVSVAGQLYFPSTTTSRNKLPSPPRMATGE